MNLEVANIVRCMPCVANKQVIISAKEKESIPLTKAVKHDPDNWKSGVTAIYGIEKTVSRVVKVLNPAKDASAAQKDKLVEQQVTGYLKNVLVAGAVYAAGLAKNGPLSKMAIDGRGTRGQEDVLNALIEDKNWKNTRVITLTGEGEKDDSIHIPTGKIYSNVADHDRVERYIHWNTDPVDGTNPTAGFNKGPNNTKKFIPGGTSIALFASPNNSSKSAFLALPDLLSIWCIATPKNSPDVELTLEGKSIADIVAINVKNVAISVLKERFGRHPYTYELIDFIKKEFKVVMMNRGFQNISILEGLKKAGMQIDFKVDAVKKNVDFSDWTADGDTMSVKHYGKGNVCMVGDGNVFFPYMKDVHLFVGNSGGPEFLQLLPGVNDVKGVFLSKEMRDKKPLDKLIADLVQGAKLDQAGKKEVFDNMFTNREKTTLKEHGFDENNSVHIFDKQSLLVNTSDYLTALTAITPLNGSKAIFPVADMEAVKINPDRDTVETSTIVAKSSGEQLLIKETFLMKTKSLKNRITAEKVDFTQIDPVNSNHYLKGIKSIINLYFDLAKFYIFYGCFNEVAKAMEGLDVFMSKVEKTEPVINNIVKNTLEHTNVFRCYMDLLTRLNNLSSKELSNKENKEKLLTFKMEVDTMKEQNLTPYIGKWMRKDLGCYSQELNGYLKKLK